ncbi:MAG: hypothetical protein QGG40_12350, partial [Myxococcota bacterium]|nr:hypothetical protein [Myxococcota bacterium]
MIVAVALLSSLLVAELTFQVRPDWLPAQVAEELRDPEFVTRRPDGELGTVYVPDLDMRWIRDGFDVELRTIPVGDGDIGARDDGLVGTPWAVALGDEWTM